MRRSSRPSSLLARPLLSPLTPALLLLLLLSEGVVLSAGAPRARAQTPRQLTATVTGTANGQASAIADMIGVQQTPFTFNDHFRLHVDPTDSLTWGERQFRRVGFNVGNLGIIDHHLDVADPSTYHITLVTQGPTVVYDDSNPDHVVVDWTDFDNRVKYLRGTLNVRYIEFTIPFGPKSVYDPASWDDPGYLAYSPTNWQRYERLVEDTVRHLNALGISAPVLEMPTEIDGGGYLGVYQNRASSTLQTRMNDYVDFYAHVWRAARRVDPKACPAAPYTISTDKSEVQRLYPGIQTLDLGDFLAALRRYIDSEKQQGRNDLDLGVIHLEQYLFSPEQPTLREMLDSVTRYLVANGFGTDKASAAKYPVVLDGWNADFVYNRENDVVPVSQPDGSISFEARRNQFYNKDLKSVDPIRRQAFLVGNMMREVAPEDGIRRLTRSMVWPLDTDFGEWSFSAVFYPEFYGYSDAPNGALYQIPVPQADQYLSPSYAALQALSEMEHDDRIYKVQVQRKVDGSADADLWTLATQNPGGTLLHLMLVNYSDVPAMVTPVPPTGGALATGTRSVRVQLVDGAPDYHSYDGNGLEQTPAVTVGSGALPSVTLQPYATARVTVTTASTP